MTRPTRYFHDWEFHERGDFRPTEMISVGMVDEYGGEFYRVSSEFDLAAAQAHPFLSREVLPLLPEESTWVPVAQIREELGAFIGLDRTEPVHLWGWCSAFDHYCLSQVFGRMIDLPRDAVEMYTRDLKQEVDRIEAATGARIELWSPPEGAHDALVDARTLRIRHGQVSMFARHAGVDGPQ